MFFFFFDELYWIQDIQQAFKNVCLKKMLFDGYIDMSQFISKTLNKEQVYNELKKSNSKFAVLYDRKEKFPKPDDAHAFWKEKIGISYSENRELILSNYESKAIVNWVYSIFKKKEDRKKFTCEVFAHIKEMYEIWNHIEEKHNIFYNTEKIELHICESMSEIGHFINKLDAKGKKILFRGHSDPNYMLLPSVLRNKEMEKNEAKMYNEILINCPEDFEKCRTHLEKLVEMQHYGLPTRLLDITKNLLVAVYFACEANRDSYGEIVILSVHEKDIKYPQSDTVTILSSLPVFSYQKQKEFENLALDKDINNSQFNQKAKRLIHEIRLEKPAFESEIIKEHIVDSFMVYAVKNNKRIIKQDGAFILCGLGDVLQTLNKYRFSVDGKKVILIVRNKEDVLRELETYSINHATLFPEIERVSQYIKSKYANL